MGPLIKFNSESKIEITIEGKIYILEHEIKSLKKIVLVNGVAIAILAVAVILLTTF